MTSRLTEAQLAELKSRNPCDEAAGKYVTLRKHGRRMIGPCPLHSPDPQARDSTAFECHADGWVCAVCCDGGDVIKLVQLAERIDFAAAIERLGGSRQVDPAEAERRTQEQARKRADRERVAASFRERERSALWEMWTRATELPNSIAELYLRDRRKLDVPPGARLRAIEDMPYYADGSRDAPAIHRGPAMLAAIVGNDGHFAGVHITYLDLDQSSGKLQLEDGLPAKKVRGSKSGGRIESVRPESPACLIIGEGIETVLSVYTALKALGRDLSDIAFWSAIDLGNLGGKAEKSLTHPSLKTPAGRAQGVPGPIPDLNSPGIAIPDTVKEIVILGDGDSEPFLTQCAVRRAASRFLRCGHELTVKVAWAPEGQDFNDLLRAA